MGLSRHFDLLHPKIQRFVWTEAWEELRVVQKLSFDKLINDLGDTILASPTASGKTEAAFFPLLTKALDSKNSQDLIVSISPLKALINDQFNRLAKLGEYVDLPVCPWHGESSQSGKRNFTRDPRGILIITPESLEAILCRKGHTIHNLFGRALAVVIDELHSYIGSDRGKQLQCLLHRIELKLNREIPRIGLSATLNSFEPAIEFLRPVRSKEVTIIDAKEPETRKKIAVEVFGILSSSCAGTASESPVSRTEFAEDSAETFDLKDTELGDGENEDDDDGDEGSSPEAEEDSIAGRRNVVIRKPKLDGSSEDKHIAFDTIANVIAPKIRTGKNLVFPNTRGAVEITTVKLLEMRDARKYSYIVYPHHGNLAKDLRLDAELSIKNSPSEVTIVCTSTLELGVDIGDIYQVFQIGCAPTVASMTQRLGRSGRRKGQIRRLIGFVMEDAPSASKGDVYTLCSSIVRFCAQLFLVGQGWSEPPNSQGAHLSTLVQQVLAVIAQEGGALPTTLYSMLCKPNAPFSTISQVDFVLLLRTLAEHKLVTSDSGGYVVLGELGDKLVNHYSFYAAFESDEEYRLIHNGTFLGSIPVTSIMQVSDRLIFAGKKWRILVIEHDAKVIQLARDRGGVPASMGSEFGRVDGHVRKTMKNIYESEQEFYFLDETGKSLLRWGREIYRLLELDTRRIICTEKSANLFSWSGDDVNETLVLLFKRAGLAAQAYDLYLEVIDTNSESTDWISVFETILSNAPVNVEDLVPKGTALKVGKWGWALPETLQIKSYASYRLNLPGALEVLREVITDLKSRQ